MSTRKNTVNIVESLAKLHEGYPAALSRDLGIALEAEHHVTAMSVYRFALARADATAAKVEALEAQAAQYRGKAARLLPGSETAYLESLAAANDQRVMRLKKNLASTLVDKRYR